MGFWIVYQYAIKSEEKELERLCGDFNKIIKDDNSLNTFREYLGIEPGGKADWIDEFKIEKRLLKTSVAIRCNYDDPIAFATALKAKTKEGTKVYFLVDETDLDPGQTIELITNAPNKKTFNIPRGYPTCFIKETI